MLETRREHHCRHHLVVLTRLCGTQGPVHAYVAMPGGRTSYLSELRSGVEVLVVDETGQTRAVVVGRLKIESRPLILVEVEVQSGTGTLLC